MQTTAPPPAADYTWLLWVLLITAGFLTLLVIYVIRKNHRLPGDHVFRASRLTKGNRIFPAQVVISPGLPVSSPVVADVPSGEVPAGEHAASTRSIAHARTLTAS